MTIPYMRLYCSSEDPITGKHFIPLKQPLQSACEATETVHRTDMKENNLAYKNHHKHSARSHNTQS